MKRKFLSILIFLLTIITLVSCIEVKEKTDYISVSEHESQIIDTTEQLKYSTVALQYSEYSRTNTLVDRGIGASAVVVKVESSLGLRRVTAITTADMLHKFQDDLRVVTNNNNKVDEILSYAYNLDYDFGVIVFETTTLLKPVKVSELADYEVGQTILTMGSLSDSTQFNSVKTGMINNDGLVYNEAGTLAFMHDAPNNPGEKGSGVFNIKGELIGLNGVNHLQTLNHEELIEYVTGMTLATRAKDFVSVLSNLDEIDYTNHNIKNSLFVPTAQSKAFTPATDYEAKLVDLYKDLSNTTVTVTKDNELATGLIYSKDSNNEYFIITKDFENFNDLKITYDGVNALNIINSYHLKDRYLSVHKVSTNVPLKTYESKAINEGSGVQLVEGQTVVMVSNPLSAANHNNFNRATLSKSMFIEDYIFMHDGELNYGMQGSPIFNLDGKLIGFNRVKENATETNNGPAIVEGINEALNINYFANEINNITYNTNVAEDPLDNLLTYTATNEYEQKLINVVQTNKDVTVTINLEAASGSAHGSGIMYKKERIGDKYRYSVLTNAHVISTSNQAVPPEINVIFNDDRETIMATDFTHLVLYDLAVVRFESTLNMGVANVKALEENVGVNLKEGQTVIAIGTPAYRERDGYTTTGNLTLPGYSYNGIVRLGINHNAPLNPGNSGGPLFDLNGDLIGLNVSKKLGFTIYDNLYIDAEGVGTTLNMNVLAPVINSFKETDFTEVVKKARLGVTVQALAGFEGEESLLPNTDNGVVVIMIQEDSDSFGKVFENDVIIGINGIEVISLYEISQELQGKSYGDTVTLKILRLENGVTKEVTVTVELR